MSLSSTREEADLFKAMPAPDHVGLGDLGVVVRAGIVNVRREGGREGGNRERGGRPRGGWVSGR